MNRCRSCGGTYEPIQTDGYLYFHVCPELSEPELRERLNLPPRPAELSREQLAELEAAPRTRENARNENIDVRKLRALELLEPAERARLGRDAAIVSAGAGVVKVKR